MPEEGERERNIIYRSAKEAGATKYGSTCIKYSDIGMTQVYIIKYSDIGMTQVYIIKYSDIGMTQVYI